ncbi:unnamed protein product [Arctia plantaginis]|uniref:Uncharacterized protein n=1 Tax=Arctia plantaginis TaxID=874455 RepID=A0A8S1BJK0_ARCPL|nr:unnamed protein product [Arctia plantaginis]
MKNVCLLLFIGLFIFLCFARDDVQKVRKKSSHRKDVIFDGFNKNYVGCRIEKVKPVFFSGEHKLIICNNSTAVLRNLSDEIKVPLDLHCFQTPGLKGYLETRFTCPVKSKKTVKKNHTKKKKPNTCETTNVRVENRNNSIFLHMIPDLPSPENKNDSKVHRETKIPKTMPGNSKKNHTKKTKTTTYKTTNERVENRNDSRGLHMIPDLTSPENKNDSKVNSETKIPEIIPCNSKTQSKALEITGIVVGYLLAVMCVFYCWRLKKRAEVTKDLQLSRSACDDYNRVKELTNQTESPEYEYIESKYNALNAHQESSTTIRAPDPTPRSALPSKNTRFQISQRGGIREMEQCRYFTSPRSGIECTHVENEYDYV